MNKKLNILICQIKPQIGNLQYNINKIRQCYQESKNNMDIILLPELATTGYDAKDLWLKKSFIVELEQQVEKLISETDNRCLLIPTIMTNKKGTYNTIIAAQNGKIIGTSSKHHLADYGVFNESRYFLSGKSNIIVINGIKVGLAICEDIWQMEAVKTLKKLGAQLILVANASPFEIGKIQKRIKVVTNRYEEAAVPLIYCNQVLAQDGLVYDGRSFVYDGKVKILSHKFAENYFDVVYQNGKIYVNSQEEKCDIEAEIYKLEEIYVSMVMALREYFNANGFNNIVLGLSGGIDSALTMAICADAIGIKNLYAVLMPSKFTSSASVYDAENMVNNLGIEHQIISIEELTQNFTSLLGVEYGDKSVDLVAQNLQSRIRGVILMALSNRDNSLLVTTGNKSEYATGYATLYGDMNGGFNPIKDLYKTQVYMIAKFRNQYVPKLIADCVDKINIIPQEILDKEPSAELSFGQKDTDSLPPYEVLDDILYNYIENDLSINAIIAKNHEEKTVKKVISLVLKSEFKRQQSAPGAKLSLKSFGLDRQYPITNKYNK